MDELTKECFPLQLRYLRNGCIDERWFRNMDEIIDWIVTEKELCNKYKESFHIFAIINDQDDTCMYFRLPEEDS